MILLDLMIALTFTMSLFALLLTLKPGRLFKFGKWPFFLGFTIVINFVTTIAACIIIVLQGNSGSGSAGHIIEFLAGLMTSGQYTLDLAVFIFLMGYGFFFILKEVNKVLLATSLFLSSWAGGIGANAEAVNSEQMNQDQAESDFDRIFATFIRFSYVDAVAKVLKADVIAVVVIILLTLLAAIAQGMMNHNLSFDQLMASYGVLIMGAGSAAMIPVWLLSIATRRAVSNDKY